MIAFGKTLKDAREAKGLTIAQVADKTHMMSSMVEDLENEDFHRIAAPIYGRGFVKLYCQTVGIEAKPMIDEFMEIFNGNRDLNINVRADIPEPIETEVKEVIEEVIAPEPPVTPISEVVAESSSRQEVQQDLFNARSDANAAMEAVQTGQSMMASDRTLSRYATPIRERDRDISALTPLIWRWLAIGVVGIVVIWLLIIGLKALYRATSDVQPAETDLVPVAAPEVPTEKPSKVVPVAKPVASRKPLKIDSLYID